MSKRKYCHCPSCRHAGWCDVNKLHKENAKLKDRWEKINAFVRALVFSTRHDLSLSVAAKEVHDKLRELDH